MFFAAHASPVAPAVKNPPANVGDLRDVGSIPGRGRSPAGGNSSPLQYSCLGYSMDRGAWWATVQGVVESDMAEQLTHMHMHTLTSNKSGKMCENYHHKQLLLYVLDHVK